eukprot:9000-Heterococcus_DN1.PRE.1
MLQGRASAAERAASRIYLAVSNPKVTFDRSKQLRSMVRELDKCSVASRKCPLREPDVLRLIFELVGPGDWAFTAAVSASWASTYKEVLAKRADANNPVVSSTSTSAVCSSAPRLRWAHHAGMQFSTEQQWTKLGKVADVETVAAAYELFEPDAAAVVRGAVASGCLFKLAWLHCQHSRCCQTLHDAVVRGASYVSSIELTSDCVFTEQTITHAASSGHAHVLSYMQEHGRALREIACMLASAKGKAAAMRWLREAGTPWGTAALKSVVQYGATSGSVEMMHFLHAQGLPFDGTTMLCAAVKGSLAVCKFLRSVQCPWNEDCCNAAVSCGHEHVLQWLLAHSCPNNADELLRRAGANGSIAIIALLAASAHPSWRALRLML